MYHIDLPIYHLERNMRLREYMRLKCISHRILAEMIIKNGDSESVERWKKKIDRFCSVTSPQHITDEDWNMFSKMLN